MNKLIFAYLMLLAVLSGCSSSTVPSTNPPVPSSTPNKPRVALVMKSLANEFFSTMADGARLHQLSHADQYELVINGIKDERDIGRQVAIVDEMVASGVNAIVIAPADSKALIAVLARAAKQGIAIVNIDNQLDQQILAQEQLKIPFVGPDNRTGAKQVGDFLVGKLKAGDSVVILEGLRTSYNAAQRLEGFKDALAEGKLTIADSQSAEWELSRANTIAASMLSEYPQVKAVLAANDSMALGALAAAKAAGRSEELLIVGFDNISAVQQAIREGKILATADQHGDQLAVYGIETALKMLSSSSGQQVESNIETPVDLVTRDTLQP
jgi:ribose transport system substrate-binding protein